MGNDHLMLIDGHALVHRAFHALPPDLTTSRGELTNAVFGFSSMLLKALETLQPTHIIMAMDRPVPTFRHLAYGEYKATRARTPDELRGQFSRVREVADAFHIPIYELDGFEADDVIGTLSLQAERQGIPVTIVTGDLDTLQLVSDAVKVLAAKRGIAETILYDEEAVRQRYGLEPGQLPDFKGLVGDTSDNIPGVRGVGEKTAAKLLSQFGTLEGIYDHLDEIPAKTRQSLQENRAQVFESRRLATIVREAPVTLQLDDAARRDMDRNRVINLFRDLEFRTLIERLQQMMPREEAPAAVEAPAGSPTQLSIFGEPEVQRVAAAETVPGQEGTVVTSAVGVVDGTFQAPRTLTRIVQTEDDLAALVAELGAAEEFAFDTETTSTDALQARLVGFSFATRPEHAWYIPVGHTEGEQLPLPVVLDALRPFLEDGRWGKIGHNLKYDWTVLCGQGVTVQNLAFDTMIAAYLLNPNARGISLSAVAMARLGVEMTPIEDLIGKGKQQITMDRVAIPTVASYAGADADISLRLKRLLAAEIETRELGTVFYRIEMPLVPVLGEMERTGIVLDTAVLEEMSREMTALIGDLEGRIYEQAGQRFNINSTQQLAQVLFNQLKLPAGRRTKTGYSTDSEVLEGLRGKHPIVDDILEYRGLIKLKNTYVDALPSLISPVDGRVHTDYNQTVASTGRLSSSNPNLQNIPVRGEVGRRIRKAFVPSGPNRVLLAADYSQIELRILAAMSGDPRLVQAFSAGEDVHRATASAVFNVSPDEVTSDQRRIAKVVNFGIVYGIGDNRLAYETGITRQEAAQFIESYNQLYAGVKAFMDEMRRRAALYGYVSTMFGRRREMPDIHSRNPGIRTAAERAAINMPIQGTAADIMKLAMIRIEQRLHEEFPATAMILQVHDELVFDVPEADIPSIASMVRQEMEHAVELSVPLEVETKAGKNWYDMTPLEVAEALH